MPRPDGGVEIYTASTDPHTDRDLAAACFGLEPDRVKVVVTGVPGATGDREEPGFQLPLGLLALRTGCPVKLAATREESFLGHSHRHPTLLRYRHHADAEGRIGEGRGADPARRGRVRRLLVRVAGRRGRVRLRPVRRPARLHRGLGGPYEQPAVRTRPGRGCDAGLRGVRGPDGQTGRQARHRPRRTAPAQRPVHRRHPAHRPDGDLPGTGGRTPGIRKGIPLPALPKDSPEDDWLLPGGPEGAGEPGAVRRGVGYALGMVHMLGAEGADEVSTATVRVHDGIATVICAAVETGQGFSTLARQVVQETLGIEEVHVASVDTDQPPAGPATHGRHTWVSAGAVERAAKMVRTQLLQPLAHKFGMSTELLQIADGKITSYDGVLSTTVTEAMDGKELWATAQCRPHPTEPLDESGQGDAFVGLAFCAIRAVVDVDIELGSVRVVEMAIAQDVGRVLNPSQLATRIEAGITQGIGAALTENLRSARGLIRHPDLTGYALPTALDAPEIRIVKLVEERDVVAPFGAKPASAVPVVTSPAAVAAAVRSATGRPINRLPIRPQAAVAASNS